MTFRSLRSLLVLALAIAPAAASATDTLTLTVEGEGTTFSKDNCDQDHRKPVRYELAAVTGYTMRISAFLITGSNSTSCPDEAPADSISLLAQTTVTDSNKTGILYVDAKDVAGDDCPANNTAKATVCMVSEYQTTSVYSTTSQWTSYAKQSLELRYDSEAPSAPTLTGATGGEAAIYLSWSGDEDVNDWVACYRKIGDAPAAQVDSCSAGSQAQALKSEDAGTAEDAGTTEPDAGTAEDAGTTEPDAGTAADAGATETDAGTAADAGTSTPLFEGCTKVSFSDTVKGSISGLINGQQYEIYMVAIDDAGNYSAASNKLQATPQNVHDFYERYRCAGGKEEGGFGCSSAGATLLPLSALAALGLLLRRRSHRRAA
jgi:hypothetical protein